MTVDISSTDVAEELITGMRWLYRLVENGDEAPSLLGGGNETGSRVARIEGRGTG